MAPSNDTLAADFSNMEKNIEKIEWHVEAIVRGMNKMKIDQLEFMADVRQNFITKIEARSSFASKFLQKVMVGIGTLAGVGVLWIIGNALFQIVKDA